MRNAECGMRGVLVSLATCALAGCAPITRIPHSAVRTPRQWADSVLATMSPRDKAAQLVWPQLFGDYTPTTSPGWIRVSDLITQ